MDMGKWIDDWGAILFILLSLLELFMGNTSAMIFILGVAILCELRAQRR
jgi:hypothetical protein